MSSRSVELDSQRLFEAGVGVFSSPEQARIWMELQRAASNILVESIDDPGPAVKLDLKVGREVMDQLTGVKTRFLEFSSDDQTAQNLLDHLEHDRLLMPICDGQNVLQTLVVCADRPYGLTTKIADWPSIQGQQVQLIDVKSLVPTPFGGANVANNWARSLQTYNHGARARVPLFLGEKTEPIAWISDFNAVERREQVVQGLMPVEISVEGEGLDKASPGNIDRGIWVTLAGAITFADEKWIGYGRECKYMTLYLTKAHFVCARLGRP